MNFKEIFSTNSWWGKILGAFFGFITSGPIGAIFGLFVGNFFDRGLSEHFTNPLRVYFDEKQETVQKIFFETTFSMMGYLAKADGRVTEAELDMARSLMKDMQLNKIQKTRAMHLFNQGKNPEFNIIAVLEPLKKACKNKQNLLKIFIDIQYQAAKIDGLTTKKIQSLNLIFTHLGFMPVNKQYRFYEDFGASHYKKTEEQEKNNHQSSSSDSYSSYSKYNYTPSKTNLDYAYALIGIPQNATKHEVKRAYRRLLSRNHPDKLMAQGLPEEMIKIANEKTQKIVTAYTLICTSKGW